MKLILLLFESSFLYNPSRRRPSSFSPIRNRLLPKLNLNSSKERIEFYSAEKGICGLSIFAAQIIATPQSAKETSSG